MATDIAHYEVPKMTELIVVDKAAEWDRLKVLVLESVSSPITRRVYNMALDEFIVWYRQEPRPGFTKATVSAWRASLEARRLGSSSIIIRISAIRKLAAEAADNGLLAPQLAAGIARVKSAKSVGIRAGNWLSLRQAQALLSSPDIARVRGCGTEPSSPFCWVAVCDGQRWRRFRSRTSSRGTGGGALWTSEASTVASGRSQCQRGSRLR